MVLVRFRRGQVQEERRWTYFVSYSDADASAVAPIVGVLRAAHLSSSDNTFWARDSIAPGTNWEDALKRALEQSRKVFVFWSHNAQQSDWVRWEYEMAIQLKRETIPVLLDETQLPNELASRQAVVLYGFGKGGSHYSAMQPRFGAAADGGSARGGGMRDRRAASAERIIIEQFRSHLPEIGLGGW